MIQGAMRYLLAFCMLFALSACQTGQETTIADEAAATESATDSEQTPDVDEEPATEPVSADPTQPRVPNATHGAEVYARVCVTCHGKSGDGRGMEMKLFGFDEPAEKWTNGPTVEGIVKTLDQGIHQSSMKPFDDYSEGDRRAVALYVLELRERLLDAETDEPGSPSTAK